MEQRLIVLGMLALMIASSFPNAAAPKTIAQRATITSTSDPTTLPSPSPSPTITSVPIATATPLPTPTATTPTAPTSPLLYLPLITTAPPPPPPPNTVAILPTHTWYVNTSGTLHIVGEIQNTTAQTVRYVRIPVNLFDTAGTLVDTDFTYTTRSVIPTGEKACFDIIVFDPPAWATYQFEPVSFTPTDDPAPRLTAIVASAGPDRTDSYRMLGQVRNDDVRRSTYVQPIITLYDAAGMVFDCDFTFVQSTNLDPGQTSAFELNFLSRTTYINVATHRVAVDGNVAN
ncbi:MAG: FxLYD domain-containing protein [Chloroflexales bacterium]|nr:FxLYD domain-containing protein [Chloroflexales bacterium]